MATTIYYLIGFPGVGKYTVALELAALTGARVVDNHYVNNPIFGLIDYDGVSPLPPAVWDRVDEVRRAVFETMATLSPRAWSFVLTNHLIETPEDHAFFRLVAELAGRRDSRLIAVRLLCDPQKLARRVATPSRRERMKSVDPAEALERADSQQVLAPDHSNTLTIDTSELEPGETARQILAYARQVAP